MAKTYLLGTMAVNLGNFIYDTHNISAIRGGSFKLLVSGEHLQKEFEKKDDVKLKPICTKASKGLFFFEAEDAYKANTVADDALDILLSHTNNQSTFVADWELLDGVDFNDTNLDEVDISKARNRLLARLNRQQYSRSTVIAPKINSAAKACCYLDGVRPGVKDWTLKKSWKNLQVKISDSVESRISSGIELRQNYFNKLSQTTQPLKYTDNLEDLANYNDNTITDKKIALIYIDGNRFGDIDAACKTAIDIENFDKAKTRIGEEFIKKLLAHASKDLSLQTKDGKLRIECLIWGGDEMTLVVPARKGWETLQLFYGTTVNGNDPPASGSFTLNGETFNLTHSAGIVFCHHNAPILFIRQIAYELANKAKSYLGNKEPEKITHDMSDSIHALVLESFDIIGSDLDSFIDTYYPSDTFNRLFIKGTELKNLSESIPIIREHFPHGKAYEIARCLRASDSSRIDQIRKRALEPLKSELRDQVNQAIDKVLSYNGSTCAQRWFLLVELWDFMT